MSTNLEIRENVNICHDCERECEDTYYVHGINSDFYVCEDCIESYDYCDYNEYHTEYGTRTVQNTENEIEDDRSVWRNYDIYECDDCGDLYRECDMHFDDYGNAICEDCYDDHYVTCCECGRIIHDYDSYWRNDCAYCEDCDPGENDFIENYGHTRYGLDFYRCDDEPVTTKEYFGVELEVDEGDDKNECAKEIDSESGMKMYFKEDGSLGDEGFEIVSSPATLRYHLENANWEEMINKAKSYGFRSHDTSTCGMHVHVSRKAFGETYVEQELHIAILMMLESKFAEKFHTFARRYSSQWAKDNLIDIDKNDDYKAIKEKSDAFKSDRYYAINVCNDATVEFRCFKGTLKYTTFVATLQFVATMTRYCQQITTADVESVQWEDIFANTEYPELREYMVSRGLL